MTLSAFFVRVNEMWALEEEEMKFIYKTRLPRENVFSRIFRSFFILSGCVSSVFTSHTIQRRIKKSQMTLGSDFQ